MKYAELVKHALRNGCVIMRNGTHVTIYAPKGHEFAATGTILVCGQSDDPKWCDFLAEDIDGGFEPIPQAEWDDRVDNSELLAFCIEKAS